MPRRNRLRQLALPLLLALACGQAFAQAWIVTEVHGSATRGGKPLALLDRLAPGDRVVLAPGSSLTGWRAGSDRQYVAAGPGRFVVTERALAGGTDGGAVHAVALDARTAPKASADTAMAGAVMRAGDGADGSEPLATARPWLQWPIHPHRGDWTLRLRDDTGQLLHEARVGANGYALPPSVPLRPGRVYYRELAWDDGGPLPRVDVARLRTLDAGDDAQAAALLAHGAADAQERRAQVLALQRLGLAQLARHIASDLFLP